MHLSSSTSGSLRPCCHCNHGKSFIKDEKGRVYRIYGEDLKKAWHSPVYRKIRQKLLNNEKPEECKYCFQKESAGLISPRQRANKHWMFEYQQSVTPPFKIRYLDIRLGNQCNLRCRMCDPYSSHQWIKEYKKMKQENSFVFPELNEFDGKMNMNWPEKMDFKKLFKNISHVEEIYFAGGEPLLIKKHYDLLDKLIDENYSSKIVLNYNTNITKLSDQILNYWKHFKLVKLSISIDGIQDLNNYIRYPSKWNLIEKNISKAESISKGETVNLEMNFTYTVQMYNILYTDEFLKWFKKRSYLPLQLSLSILNDPKFLNIKVLPKVLKKRVEEKLLPFKDEFPVLSLISYMNKEDWSQYLSLFFKYSDFLDRSRNQKMSKILPELESYRNHL